ARLSRQRARDLETLAISARQGGGRDLGTAGPNSKSRQELPAQIKRALAVQPSVPHKALSYRAREQHILPKFHPEDKPVEIAILRDHRDRAGFLPARTGDSSHPARGG